MEPSKGLPYIHSTAVIDEGAKIGEGTRVWHFVHVSSDTQIGRDCVLGQNVYVAPGVVVGDRVRIQNSVSLFTGVIIEDEVFLGPSCVFTNVAHPRAFVSRKDEYLATHVGRGATIGANATVVCGHEIGDYAFIGAGAVVTRDVPPHALTFGNPARQQGWVCRCGERLVVENAGSTCSRCGLKYDIDDAGCRFSSDGSDPPQGSP